MTLAISKKPNPLHSRHHLVTLKVLSPFPLPTAFTLPKPSFCQSSTLSVALATCPSPPTQVSKAAESQTAQENCERTRLWERIREDLLSLCKDLLKHAEFGGSSTQPFGEALPKVSTLCFTLADHRSQKDGHGCAPASAEGTPKCLVVTCQALKWE